MLSFDWINKSKMHSDINWKLLWSSLNFYILRSITTDKKASEIDTHTEAKKCGQWNQRNDQK